ncbi:MAG: DUF2141 domain-containing protein [Tunicatimonas sp.]|uniref:DUF2141 domain-containing protein n=1 Tax=Tunicatimonas sp. TaxID=1940096 RepID=UPI003C7667B5
MLILLAIHALLSSDILPNTTVNQELTIEILGLSSYEGQVQIAVFTVDDDFPDKGTYQKSVPLDPANKVQASFTLPEGDYAVAAYHDKNENGKLDTNMVGIPKEDYGFSNDARGKMSAPPFDKAKVTVQQAAQTIQINLR